MGTYIYSILCASLAVSVLCALAPEKEDSAKYVAFAGALAVALCVLYPLVGGSGFVLPELFSDYEKGEISDSRAAAEYTARNAILSFCALSGAETDSVMATVEFSENGTNVTLDCGMYIVGSTADIEAKLKDILGVNITVCSGGG